MSGFILSCFVLLFLEGILCVAVDYSLVLLTSFRKQVSESHLSWTAIYALKVILKFMTNLRTFVFCRCTCNCAYYPAVLLTFIPSTFASHDSQKVESDRIYLMRFEFQTSNRVYETTVCLISYVNYLDFKHDA